MRIDVSSNIPDIERQIRSLGGQVKFAAAVALTRAAKDAQAAIRQEMQRAFDRPTAYALNGTFLKPATKANLEARVWVKDEGAGKGTTADRFLLPEIYGGKRGQKGMERLLQRNGMMPANWFAVPAVGAQLDGNGNVKRSQIVQILSQLQVQKSAGYESRRSTSGASRRAVARQGVTYFVLPYARRGLRAGIYLKRKLARGSSIQPVFLFVSNILYRPRFKFFDVGQAVAERRFAFHYDAELANAIATARLR